MPDESNPDQPAKPRGVRWWPALFIIGIIGVVEWMVYLHFVRKEDQTLQGVSLLVASFLTGVLLLIWWVLFSRTRWYVRIGGLVLIAGVASLLRFDGFRGDMVPQFSFRWEMTPKQNAERRRLELAGEQGLVTDSIELLDADYLAKDSDWPGFRGERRDGIVRKLEYSDAWLRPEELWRIPMGDGWSSFAAAGQFVWTQEQQGDEEVVTAYNARTGAQVWRHADAARFEEAMGGPGPRATPTYYRGKLYTLGSTGILNCFEAGTGKRVWSINILDDNSASNIQWAMAGSPLVYEQFVVVSPGGKEGKSLVAYDRETGEKRWSGGDSIASYASPQIFTIRGQEQILSFNGVGIAAHRVDDGSVLWTFPWSSSPKINVAQPLVFKEEAVLLSVGYTKGAILLDVKRNGNEWSAEERWRSIRLKSKFNNFVLKDEFVYGFDEGILVCLDVAGSHRRWKGGRYGFGQMLLVGDVLVIQAENGEVVFVKATPDDHVELGRFQAIEGKTWNHPAIARGRLFVRNGQEAACYKLTDWPYSPVAEP